jgi:hypothetical protein
VTGGCILCTAINFKMALAPQLVQRKTEGQVHQRMQDFIKVTTSQNISPT